MSTLPKISERVFQSQVLQLCKWLGLLAYHTHDSRRSQPGYPDLTIVGPCGVVFAELKTETGRVSPAQQQWLDALAAAGLDAYVWRPSHLHDGVIQERLEALAGRTTKGTR